MKKSIQLSSLAAAIALSTTALVPATAMAGTSATLGVSNFYLFRGLDLSNPNAQVSGSVQYSHDSGAYAGVWVSNSGTATSGEYDLYVGYGKEIAGVTLDANLTTYEYPGLDADIASTAQKFGNLGELIVSASYMGAKLSIADSLQSSAQGGGYIYYSLSYNLNPVTSLPITALVGTQKNDATAANDYTHVDVSYALNNEVSLTVSQIVDQDSTGANNLDTDPKINLAWTKKFDL